ncbi:hypothetical protein TNCT_324221, partial [Trichonephila clavata]
DGHLFPQEVRIYIAPISDHQEYEYSVEFWKKVEDAYKVDMSALASTAAEQMRDSEYAFSNHIWVTSQLSNKIIPNAHKDLLDAAVLDEKLFMDLLSGLLYIFQMILSSQLHLMKGKHTGNNLYFTYLLYMLNRYCDIRKIMDSERRSVSQVFRYRA